MLFSNSPVKNIVEKLNPFSQKNKISRLKFERKGDYKIFLKFIKDNTKEIADIDISGEDKKRKGLLIGGGILGLALLSSLGKSDDDDSGVPRKIGEIQNLNDVLRKVKADKQRVTPADRSKKSISDVSRISKIYNKRQVIVNPPETKITKRGSRTIVKKFGKKKIVSPLTVRTPVTTGVGDSQSGSGNRRDIYDITSKESKNIKEITKPKSGEIAKQQRILRNFNKSQITEPTRINDQNFKNLKNLISGNLGSDELDNLIKIQRGYDSEGNKTNKLDQEISAKRSRETLRADRIRSMYDVDGGVGDSNVGDMTQNKSSKRRTRATIDRSKFFEAPEIPKKITPKKLNNFDKFNRFSNRILNSPAAKFTTFMGGLFANPKFMIIKTLMEPTPLADGTLEGKPGVSAFSEQLMFDEDMAVNIFMPPEERESMIPFDANITPPPDTPTDLQAPSTNVFIDYEFNTSEDLFFIKMAGS